MASLLCPVCANPLIQVPLHGRASPICAKKHGRVLATSALRRWLEPEKIPLFDTAFQKFAKGKRPCERCKQPMRLARFEQNFDLDFCEDCSLTWIAEGKLTRLPLQTEEEIEALEASGTGIDVYVDIGVNPHLGRMGIEGVRGEKPGLPLATMGLVMTCWLVSQLGWRNHLEGFLFDPRHPLEKFGSPLVLSTFAHANYSHLIGNMVFFFWPAAVIEATFGPEVLLQLFFACGLVSSLVQGMADPTRLQLGASGAIAGVYAAVCVAQPNAKAVQTEWSFMTFGFVSLTTVIPMPLVFLMFLAEQVYSATYDHYVGTGGIGYFAHLGGAATGLAYVWLVRPKYLGRLSQAGKKKGSGN